MPRWERIDQPFDEIVDGTSGRRLTSAVDLVRPDDDWEDRPPRVSRWLLLWIALGLLAGAVFVLPAIDREMMRGPMVDAVAAVRAGDLTALRACFTPDAEIGHQELLLDAGEAIRLAEPYIRGYGGAGRLRFSRYQEPRRTGKGRVEAGFVVVFDAGGGEDVPYRHVPVRKTGHVTLQRTGWFRWKIRRLTSDEPEIGQVLRGTLLRDLPLDEGDDDAGAAGDDSG